MIYAPNHIKKYVKQIQGENRFFNDGIYDEFTFAYEIICSCGCKEFVVYKNSEPKVIASCTSCGTQITLYDLIEYPCSVLVKENMDELKKVTNGTNDKFNVAIIFQYSDDEEFDENEVCWCQIYLYDIAHLQSIMIVDDETA